MKQRSIMDYLQDVRTPAEAARDEAMDRVEENAAEEWKRAAWAVLQRVARTHAEFTTDDLVECGCPAPREPRALGPLMRAAVKAGLCKPTGTYRKSILVSCHARPKLVYSSTVNTTRKEEGHDHA